MNFLKMISFCCTVFFLIMSCGHEAPSVDGDGERFDPIPENSSWKLEENLGATTTSGGKIALVSHYTIDEGNLPFIELAVKKNHIPYAKKHGYHYFFRNGTIDEKIINGQKHYSFSWPDRKKNRTFQLGLYWQKIRAVRDLLEKKSGANYTYDYVMWIDTDAIFTNWDQKIEDFIDTAPPDTFFFIAQDINSPSPYNIRTCVNAGVFIVKNSKEGRNFIDDIEHSYEIYKNIRLPEQAAIQDLIFGYYTKKDKPKILLTPDSLKNFQENILQRDCSVEPIKNTKILHMRNLNSGYPWDLERVRWTPQSYIAHFLTLGSSLTTKYLDVLLKCLDHFNYENRENCTPQKLRIILPDGP